MADGPTYLDDTGEYAAPTATIESRTLIFDRAHNRQVMWLEGWPRPGGSRRRCAPTWRSPTEAPAELLLLWIAALS